jgi:hypothetical protein
VWSRGGSRVVSQAPRIVWLRDFATWLSRAELAIAFVAAALLGGFLSTLQDILPGSAAVEVKWLAAGLLVVLFAAIAAWVLARTYSLDLGAFLSVRRGQLQGRPAVSAALERSSRTWIPFEVVDDLDAWSDRVPDALGELTRSLAGPLSASVGRPRVLIALSTSDAVGFFLGNVLRPTFLGADVQVMTLPTGSQSWRSVRYSAGQVLHRRVFEVSEMSGTGCQCDPARGAGVIDPLRSPDHNPELVLASLISQGIVCCTGAVHMLPSKRSVDEPVSGRYVIDAIRFFRARARWLTSRHGHREVDITLTVGPEVSMLAGFMLAGFCSWHVWEFDRKTARWKTRWKSD